MATSRTPPTPTSAPLGAAVRAGGSGVRRSTPASHCGTSATWLPRSQMAPPRPTPLLRTVPGWWHWPPAPPPPSLTLPGPGRHAYPPSRSSSRRAAPSCSPTRTAATSRRSLGSRPSSASAPRPPAAPPPRAVPGAPPSASFHCGATGPWALALPQYFVLPGWFMFHRRFVPWEVGFHIRMRRMGRMGRWPTPLYSHHHHPSTFGGGPRPGCWTGLRPRRSCGGPAPAPAAPPGPRGPGGG